MHYSKLHFTCFVLIVILGRAQFIRQVLCILSEQKQMHLQIQKKSYVRREGLVLYIYVTELA